MNKNKFVKIFWNDAVIYKSRTHKLELAEKITQGELVKKTEDYALVKNPITSDYDENEKIYIPQVDSKHTFFLIPKGMIKKIVERKSR